MWVRPREERKTVRAQAETDVHARREYRALKAMQFGQNPDGTPIEDGTPMRLSRADIIKVSGKAVLADLPRAPRPIYTTGEGMPVADVARRFEYDPADALIQAMRQLQPMKRCIESETDVRMAEVYNHAVDRINRAVRIERLYVDPRHFLVVPKGRLLMSVPMFSRTDVTRWATEKFLAFRSLVVELFGDAESAVGSSPEDALDSWKHEDAWTLDEFAKLCCGWIPSPVHPDQKAWKKAVKRIESAVSVKKLQVCELRWPGTDLEKDYAEVPLFRPSEGVRWVKEWKERSPDEAKERFPDEFPFDPDEWQEEPITPEQPRAEVEASGSGSTDVQVAEDVPQQNSDVPWEHMTMRFRNPRWVQVTIEGRLQEPQSYKDLGFIDKKTKNPNYAWQALLGLAEGDGRVESTPLRCKWARNWKGVNKRMAEIRQKLCTAYKLKGDPVPFVREIGYQTAFKFDPDSDLDS